MQQRSLTLRWLWLIPGVALLIAGLIIGLSSQQVNASDIYQKIAQTSNYTLYIGSLGNIYLTQSGTAGYFVAQKDDIHPTISTSILAGASSLSLVARTDTIGVNAQISGATISAARPIEQIIFYGPGGQQLASYTTDEYAAYLLNPASVTDQNRWPLGAGLVIAGLLIALFCYLFFIRKREPRVAGAYPYVSQPGFPPPSQAGYPPQPGFPPPSQPGYTPVAQPGYLPPSQPGYTPVAQPGYPPIAQQQYGQPPVYGSSQQASSSQPSTSYTSPAAYQQPLSAEQFGERPANAPALPQKPQE